MKPETMENEARTVCVITGDLINSSSLTRAQKDALPIALEEALKDQCGIILPLAFFHGDGLQILCEPSSSIDLALLIESVIKSTTGTLARMALALGGVNHIHETDVRKSSGEAFTLSENLLETLKPNNHIFRIKSLNANDNANLYAIATMIEKIIIECDIEQANRYSAFLRGKKINTANDRQNQSISGNFILMEMEKMHTSIEPFTRQSKQKNPNKKENKC